MSEHARSWPLSRLATGLAYDALLQPARTATGVTPPMSARGGPRPAPSPPRTVPLEALLRAAVALDVLATLTTYVKTETAGAVPLGQAAVRAAELSGATPEALEAVTATTQGAQGEARLLAAQHVTQAVEARGLADDDAVLRLIEAAARDAIAAARLRLQARDQQSRGR